MKTTRILWAFALGVFLTGTLTSCKKNQKEISQQEFQQMLDDAEKKGEEKAKKEMQQQTQEEQAAKDKQQVKEPVATADRNDISVESLSLTGTIGGADDAVFNYNADMDNGTVAFTISGVVNERRIKQGSYDPQSGRLVMREFTSNGSYIGDFVGTWRNGVYAGVFTNKKTGGKVDFRLR